MNALYKVKRGMDVSGPFTESQLRSMWNLGSLTADSLYSPEGEDNWQPLPALCEPSAQTESGSTADLKTKENSTSPAKGSSERWRFWINILFFGFVALGAYVLIATDGCQRSVLPVIRKGSFEAPVSIPSDETLKVTGKASHHNGTFSSDLYNGTEWTLTRIDVVVVRKKEPHEQRRFRLAPPETTTDIDQTTMKLVEKKVSPLVKPYSQGDFRGEVADFLNGAESGDWTWGIVELFGFRD